jgi:regulator of cell morphogenesis and NO signaling
MNDFPNKTLSQIVTMHHQTAQVFENYGLDFCCKGKRSLNSACKEKQIPLQDILRDIDQALQTEAASSAFNTMSLTELVENIVRVHHGYVKANLPQITEYIFRVATKHGDTFPYMKEVYALFTHLKQQFEEHMVKEEKVLFPRIKLLELNYYEHKNADYVQLPIQMMEQEHDEAGDIMQKIRELTNDFTPPAQACTTFRLALNSLKAFEQDLHQHVHLENNILFPKAIELFGQPGSCALEN